MLKKILLISSVVCVNINSSIGSENLKINRDYIKTIINESTLEEIGARIDQSSDLNIKQRMLNMLYLEGCENGDLNLITFLIQNFKEFLQYKPENLSIILNGFSKALNKKYFEICRIIYHNCFGESQNEILKQAYLSADQLETILFLESLITSPGKFGKQYIEKFVNSCKFGNFDLINHFYPKIKKQFLLSGQYLSLQRAVKICLENGHMHVLNFLFEKDEINKIRGCTR